MTEATSAAQTTMEEVVLKHELEQFLFKEARLLDERRLDEWLDLLAEDLHYWMPMRRNIKFGDWDLEFTDMDSEINWFDEGKDILAGRIRQLNTGVHWPEEPVSRFEHIVTNVELVSVEGDEVRVNSKFLLLPEPPPGRGEQLRRQTRGPPAPRPPRPASNSSSASSSSPRTSCCPRCSTPSCNTRHSREGGNPERVGEERLIPSPLRGEG